MKEFHGKKIKIIFLQMLKFSKITFYFQRKKILIKKKTGQFYFSKWDHKKKLKIKKLISRQTCVKASLVLGWSTPGGETGQLAKKTIHTHTHTHTETKTQRKCIFLCWATNNNYLL
jgi:hypothetical protein